jgi:hypothetical protein
MLREYETPLIGEGTDSSPREPALCAVYSGTWGSSPGATEDTIIVVADVTDEQHAAILAVDGVSEVDS